MNLVLATLVPQRLVRLSSVDLTIIAIYFLAVLCIGFYLKRFAQSGEDFFLAGREMTAWVAGLSYPRSHQSGFTGIARLGGFFLSIRNPCSALVLDRRDSRNAVSRHRDDAVLLHIENAFGAWLPATALWKSGKRLERGVVRLHDHSDVRREHVCDGQSDAGGAGLEHPLQHLGIIADGGNLRGVWRVVFRDLQ